MLPDAVGNLEPGKDKSADGIDGIVAARDGPWGGPWVSGDGKSVYERRGVLVVG